MTNDSTIKRANELRNLLNKASHAYYVLDSPIMEDSIYDNLYRELIDIETADPSLLTKDSPSQRIGGSPAKKFINVAHRIPLFSLDNAFNTDELNNWYSRIKKLINTASSDQSIKQAFTLVGEMKIDGNALALSYSKGVLVQAATRGDGLKGEEITANVRTINSIPLRLQLKTPPLWLEVRGEAFIPDHTFKKINSERQKLGTGEFANPRNACAGTLRQLNPQVVASRQLDFFAYSMHISEEWKAQIQDPAKPTSQWEALQWLKTAGFRINPISQHLKNLDEATNFINHSKNSRKELPYATDGVVIKINEYSLQQQAGFTQKAPRWAIAVKYPAEEAATKLLKMTCQVGRTGVITPVVEFEPITLAGTSVTRATLHNAARIGKLGLHYGDTIVVHKAGEIIPEIVRVLKELRPSNALPIELPTNCPSCNSPVIKAIDEAATRCVNNSCPAILQGALRHWVSKESMDIDGFGEKLIEQLVNRKLVKSIASLYHLNETSLSKIERMGTKSAKKIISSLEKSKTQPWHKQLYGLGILHVGKTNANTIAKNFNNIIELSNTACSSPEKIKSLYGIGDEIAQSLKQWFSTPSNQILISQLQCIGITLKANEKNENESKNISSKYTLDGTIFVLTGTIESLSRDKLKSLIEEAGGKVNTSLSSKTNYLVAGDKAGSKLQKAQQLGIPILNKEAFYQLLSK